MLPDVVVADAIDAGDSGIVVPATLYRQNDFGFWPEQCASGCRYH